MAIREVLRKLFFYDKWDIGIYRGSVGEFIEAKDTSQIKWLNRHSKYSFVADPCILQSKDRLKILAEYFNYFTCKGKIVLLETGLDFNNPNITDEIVTEHHMSYPHIFEFAGEKYCIVEASAANKIMLYKYAAGKFIYEKNLIENFAGVDSTILHYNNKWWLFCTRGPSSYNRDLYIFHSENPLSGWQPHKNNPVKSDVASARPAGNFFYMDGKLCRPSQNCSKTYGGSLVINEVIALDEENFKEQEVAQIYPGNAVYPDGIHTICIGDGVVVVDGKKLQFSLFNPVFIIIQKIKALQNMKCKS